MEKSVKNAVFKGFPVLMESGPFVSKQYSQTTNKETNNSLRSFFKELYLVSKCMSKRVADKSDKNQSKMLFSRGFQYSWSQVLFDQNNTLRQQIKKKTIS